METNRNLQRCGKELRSTSRKHLKRQTRAGRAAAKKRVEATLKVTKSEFSYFIIKTTITILVDLDSYLDISLRTNNTD